MLSAVYGAVLGWQRAVWMHIFVPSKQQHTSLNSMNQLVPVLRLVKLCLQPHGCWVTNRPDFFLSFFSWLRCHIISFKHVTDYDVCYSQNGTLSWKCWGDTHGSLGVFELHESLAKPQQCFERKRPWLFSPSISVCLSRV